MPRMYDDLAHLWPVISPPGGYALEGALWRRLLDERLGDGPHTMLDLGVGGGHHMKYLQPGPGSAAVDLSAGMLEHSRLLNPEVEHHVGDMRSFRLGRRVDAVVVHDAVAYMRSEADLAALFETAALHLEPGGVFMTAPDHVRETFVDPTVRTRTGFYEGDRELTFFEYAHDPDPGDTTYETLYLYVLRQGGGRPETIQDTHVHGLFPLDTWRRLLEEAGFAFTTQRHQLEGPTHEGYLMIGERL